MSVNLVHFYGVSVVSPLFEADKERLAGHRGAVLEGAKRAQGRPITIRFREGGAMLRGRVQAAAEE